MSYFMPSMSSMSSMSKKVKTELNPNALEFIPENKEMHRKQCKNTQIFIPKLFSLLKK